MLELLRRAAFAFPRGHVDDGRQRAGIAGSNVLPGLCVCVAEVDTKAYAKAGAGGGGAVLNVAPRQLAGGEVIVLSLCRGRTALDEPGSSGAGQARAAPEQWQGVMRQHQKPWQKRSPRRSDPPCRRR